MQVSNIVSNFKNYALAALFAVNMGGSISSCSRVEPEVFMYKVDAGKTRLDDKVFEVANYVHPMFWNVKNGKIKYNDSDSEISTYVKSAHSKGVKVLPGFFSQGENTMQVLANPDKYVSQLLDLINKYELDGILIDVENRHASSSDKDNLSGFVEKLNDALNEQDPEAKIAIAVSAMWEGSTEKYPHHGMYDLKKLNEEADYIQFMCYDFNSCEASSSIRPERLEQIVDYIDGKVDANKTVMILPFYGRLFYKNGKPAPQASYNVVGTRNNADYGTSGEYVDGDLKLETKDRILYTQDEKTIKDRVEYLADKGIKKVGAWQQNQGYEELIDALASQK